MVRAAARTLASEAELDENAGSPTISPAPSAATTVALASLRKPWPKGADCARRELELASKANISPPPAMNRLRALARRPARLTATLPATSGYFPFFRDRWGPAGCLIQHTPVARGGMCARSQA